MLRLSRCLSGLSVPFDMNPMYFFLWRDGPVAGTTKSLVSFLSRLLRGSGRAAVVKQVLTVKLTVLGKLLAPF